MAENEAKYSEETIEHPNEHHAIVQRLYIELEIEREASATAAREALSMILRLQEEKAAEQMEALQYKRMVEEKIRHDEELLAIFEELLHQKDIEIASLRSQLKLYSFSGLENSILSATSFTDSCCKTDAVDEEKLKEAEGNMRLSYPSSDPEIDSSGSGYIVQEDSASSCSSLRVKLPTKKVNCAGSLDIYEVPRSGESGLKNPKTGLNEIDRVEKKLEIFEEEDIGKMQVKLLSKISMQLCVICSQLKEPPAKRNVSRDNSSVIPVMEAMLFFLA